MKIRPPLFFFLFWPQNGKKRIHVKIRQWNFQDNICHTRLFNEFRNSDIFNTGYERENLVYIYHICIRKKKRHWFIFFQRIRWIGEMDDLRPTIPHISNSTDRSFFSRTVWMIRDGKIVSVCARLGFMYYYSVRNVRMYVTSTPLKLNQLSPILLFPL